MVIATTLDIHCIALDSVVTLSACARGRVGEFRCTRTRQLRELERGQSSEIRRFSNVAA